MRVAIDARKLHDFGIGTYVRNLVRYLARLDPVSEYILICRPEDEAEAAAAGPNFRAVVDQSRNYTIRELLSIPLAVHRAHVDVFHAPHYVVSPLVRCPLVVTIHDCIHLRYPQYLPSRAGAWYARAFMSLAARKAARILTVSEASRQDILHYLHPPPSKIEVIYNGIDERFATPPSDGEVARTRERFQITAPFVLYAGNIKPHKNVDRLIEAFALLREREGGELKLLVIGDQISRYANLRRLVHRHHLHQHVRFLGFVPHATLAVLYHLATVFVFPSLVEGFGFPPLEAMASGTPVITSNVSSLPEVVGDAALQVDPLDPRAIADALARVLGDAPLRADLIRRGHERVKAFVWRESVARILDVYRDVAAGAARRG